MIEAANGVCGPSPAEGRMRLRYGVNETDSWWYFARGPQRKRSGGWPGGGRRLSSPTGCQRCAAPSRSYEKIQAVRSAPLSDPGRYIAFLDERGEEICLVRDPAELEEATRRVLDEELTRRYLTAVVRRIYSVRIEAGVAYLDVQTNRGRREFIVHNAHESARWLGDQRLLLLDVDGNRFEIPDLGAFDRLSARLLAQAL